MWASLSLVKEGTIVNQEKEGSGILERDYKLESSLSHPFVDKVFRSSHDLTTGQYLYFSATI